MDQTVADQIAEFVNKSGGVQKMEELRECIRAVSESGQHCDLLARLSASDPPGAKQLLACALVGIALSLEIVAFSREAFPNPSQVN